MTTDGLMVLFSITLASLGKKGPGKHPKKTPYSVLKPSDFGLPESTCSKVKVYSLFNNNKIITKEKFEQKFNCQIIFLDYAKLTRALSEVIKTTNRKKNMNAEETPPHFKFKF